MNIPTRARAATPATTTDHQPGTGRGDADRTPAGDAGSRGGTALSAAGSLFSSQRGRRLLPLVFITYSFAYLDRSNYSLGAAGGLENALHLTSGRAGLLGGLFFIGYFLFQVPAADFAERRGIRQLMFISLILWGVLAALQGVIDSYPLFLADRFALGVVEAAVIPAMLVFVTHWFSSHERGRADTFLILGNPVTLLWMSVISGYLIEATSYRWMFVIEGVPAIVWAFVFRALVADRPADATWLDKGEREQIEGRLKAEQAALPAVSREREVFKSWNVWVLAVQYALWSIGVYGFVFWLPTIVKALSGAGIGTTGLLSAAPYAAGAILMIGNSWVSDRVGRSRRLFVWPFLIVGAIAFYLSFVVGTGHFVTSFVLLIIAGAVMYAPYGPYFAFIPEFMPQNVSGTAMGAINAFGALGGFAGPYVVGLLGGGTKAGGAFVFMAASLLVAGLLMFLVRRPRVAQASQQPRRHPAARAAQALASASGASPDPLYGRPTSALRSGRHKTH